MSVQMLTQEPVLIQEQVVVGDATELLQSKATFQTQNQERQRMILLETYRFVFAHEMAEQLSIFAQVHQYDERKIFKEAWQSWIEEDEIKQIIDAEVGRIHALGFVGDVLDKMFKSARYYYRKKTNVPTKHQDRKEYEGIPQTILMQMDEHINTQIKANIFENKTKNDTTDTTTPLVSKISPATSFDNYCAENQKIILEFIKEYENIPIEKINRELVTDVIKRLKKTYKNRFYNIRVAHNKTK